MATRNQQLKINGREVPTVSNQMIFDLTDFDLGVPVEEPKKKLQECECGAWATGIEDFMHGHSDYCPVHEDKTPLIYR